MAERQRQTLRLQPQAIPALRLEFRAAIDQVSATLTDLKRRAYVTSPWLGDEVSSEVVVHYTQQAMNGPESSYEALVAYRDELTRAHDTLQQMEDDYRRADGDDAARWGRMA